MILQQFLATETAISDLLNPALWLTDALAGRRTQSGEYISPDGAMALSAYFAAIRAISEDIGKLPLKVYKRLRPRGKEELPDHEAYRLLHRQPNPFQSACVFRETLTAWALGWGNGYAELINESGNVPLEMLPIHPMYVTPELAEGKIVYHLRKPDIPEYVLPQDRIFHLHGLGGDGISGYSVASIGAESMGLSLAAQTFGSAFFGNGSAVGGVLKHPQTLSEDALKHLRESWTNLYAGPANAYKPAILEEGMTWERVGIPPEDAQFLETRQLQVEEIARWFRIPPHKIQHLTHATFSNIEQQSIEYVTDTLMPWLVRWEQEIALKILPTEEEIFAEHVVTGLLRGDQAARAAFYNQQFQVGALSQNDIRELENHNPIGPDGDVYYIPSNMTRSEDAAQGLVASSAGPPGSEEPEEEAPEEEEEETPDEELEEEAPPEEEAKVSIKPRAQQSVRDAMAPVIAAAVLALLRKEVRAARKAAEKCNGQSQAFGAWLDRWYPEQRGEIIDDLTPVSMAFAALAGDQCRVGQVLHDLAAGWELESRAMLLEAYRAQMVPQVTDAWIPQRQVALSNQLLDRMQS